MTDAIQNGEVGSSVRAKLNQNIVDVAALQAEAALSFDTVAALLADSTLTYVTAPAGTIVEAGGFRYTVAASAASDQHVTTAGGVKLYVQAGTNGFDVRAFGAVGDGTADDRPAFVAMNAAGGDAYIPKPPVGYNVSSAIDLDKLSPMTDPTATWTALTDGGQISWTTTPGAVTNVGAINTRAAGIHRFSDRVFVGGAAAELAGDSLSADGGESWMSDSTTAPAYLAVNAQMVSVARHLPYALVGAARTSDQINNGKTAIGVASAVVNNSASGNAWGFIAEVQHEAGANLTLAMEVGAKYKGASLPTVRAPYTTSGGVMGLWMAGGGDANFGGAATYPANAAMVVLRNAQSGLSAGWQTGIVFTSDALSGASTGTTGTGTAVAIGFARNHVLRWYEPTNGLTGAQITSQVTAQSNGVQMIFKNDLIELAGVAGATSLGVSVGAGADYLTVGNLSTGTARIGAAGTSTDVDIAVVPKGAGYVRFGTRTASSDVPVTGYMEVKDASGTVRRLAVVG